MARLNKANGEKKASSALLDLCGRFLSNFDVEQLRLCLPRGESISSPNKERKEMTAQCHNCRGLCCVMLKSARRLNR